MSRVHTSTVSAHPSTFTDSYIYEIEPAGPNSLALSTSADEIFLLDTLTLKIEQVLTQISPGLTCLRIASQARNLLFSGGRGGDVCAYDSRIPNPRFKLKIDRPVNTLAVSADGRRLAIGTELHNHRADIQLWDTRQQRLIWQSNESNDDVTDLQFHSTQLDRLLSGTIDGLVSVFNTTITDEDDSLLQVVNHGAIHKCGFLDSGRIYALSTDEHLSVHALSEHLPDDAGESEPTKFGDLRPLLGCEYVVDIVNAGGLTYIASGTHSEASKQNITLYPLKAESEVSIDQNMPIVLAGSHGEEIVRTIHLDSNTNMAYTGGEDGIVKMWTPIAGEAAETELSILKSGKKGKASRYRPY